MNDFDDPRGAAAFRSAADATGDGPEVDLVEVRRRVRRRHGYRWAAAVVAVVVPIGLGIAIVQYGGAGHMQIAHPKPAATATATTPPIRKDPAPRGWRTEYYRNISFQVPATWGYAYAPDSSWCASYPDGKPTGAITNPYVSLGERAVVPAIGCRDLPASLTTEHVAVRELGPAEDFAMRWSGKSGRWWHVGRSFGSVVIFVVSENRRDAERIAASAVKNPLGAPCAPRSSVGSKESARPSPFDLTTIRGVQRLVICQYDADEAQMQLEHGLRAVVDLTGPAAEKLVATLQGAPRNRAKACNPAPDDWTPDLTLRLLIVADDGTHELFVIGAGCPSQMTASPHGIDDGTVVRRLTRDACRALLVPPVRMEVGSGDIGQNCLG